MLLFLIAFIAGVLTVLAPCVLPLLPVIVGGSVSGGVNKARAYTVAFSLGVSVILFTLLLKASTAFIGIPQYAWMWFSGGVLVVFGIITLIPQIWDKIGLVNTLSRESNKAMSAGFMKQTFWGNPDGYDPNWVYHGLLVGPPSDAANFLRRLFSESFLSEGARSAMKAMHALGGSIAGRPWTKIGYGLGLMMGEMADAGAAFGHSGVGHDCVSSLYCFPELSGSPVVAVFGQGTDEGITEAEAVRLALDR